MKLDELLEWVSNKERFLTLENYIEFCKSFVLYIEKNMQADIVSKNEPHYHFIQYRQEGNFNVTRPLNYHLMYSSKESDLFSKNFINILDSIRKRKTDTKTNRAIVNRSVYTIQQSIGAALDALPSGMSNKARKINGDLFERLICLTLNRVGVDCASEIFDAPVVIDGKKAFIMKYHHDFVVKSGDLTKLVGSVKNSSKDRLDKIFIDKFLLSRLTEQTIPHVAIFLNDVQRKGKKPQNYGVGSTFLPGHFKGYTIKLNPLDGVYYCDIRPNMISEDILKDHIKTYDHFLFEDIWFFLR